jgi:hypothetical protein
MRTLLIIALLSGCGAAAKNTGVNPNLPHVNPNDDVGDVVTGSMSAPESPGLNGPSTPGGTGAGGGTPRPKKN